MLSVKNKLIMLYIVMPSVVGPFKRAFAVSISSIDNPPIQQVKYLSSLRRLYSPTTFSITTFSITTLSIMTNKTGHSGQWQSIVMLIVMHKPLMLGVILLNVVMLSVVAPILTIL
jgi:hypothetical protein